MKVAIAIIFCVLAAKATRAQGEVFRVKRSADTAAKIRLIKLDLFQGVDTLAYNWKTREFPTFDFSPAIGLYDSIATYNLRYEIHGTQITLDASNAYAVTGIFKLFRRKENGQMELFFMKSFVLGGLSYSISR